MLKVKVEPVDPSLRGNVQLPNGGASLSDYRQLYLNPGLVDDHDTKHGVDVEEHVEEEEEEVVRGLVEDNFPADDDGQDVVRSEGFTIEEGESNVIETVEETEVSMDPDGRLVMVANEQQEAMAVQEVIEVPYLPSGDSMSNVVILEEEGTTQYIITEGQAPFLTSDGVDEEMTLDTALSTGAESDGHPVVVERLECEEEPFIPQHARGPLTPSSHYGTDLEDSEAAGDVQCSVNVLTTMPQVTTTGKNLNKLVKAKLTRKLSDRQLSSDGTVAPASGGKKRKRKGSDGTGNQSKKKVLNSPTVKPSVGVLPVASSAVSPSALPMPPYLIYSKELNTYIQVLPITSQLHQQSESEANIAAENIARPQMVSLSETLYGQPNVMPITSPPPAILNSPKSQPSTPKQPSLSAAKRTLSLIQKRHPLITSILSRGVLSPQLPLSPHKLPVTTATATSPTVQSPIRASDSLLSSSPASDVSNPEPRPIIISVTSLATPTTDTHTTAQTPSPRLVEEATISSPPISTETIVPPPITVTSPPAGTTTTLVIPVRALAQAQAAAQAASTPKTPPAAASVTKTLLKVPSVVARKALASSSKLATLTSVAASKVAAVKPELKPQLSVEPTAMKSLLQSPTVAAVALSKEVIDLSETDDEPHPKVATQETLADKYMREWKPTGKFQCRFCVYSCVTQNFLFRHWVMNHSGVRPYICGHCPMRSPTRDGLTRHMTAKHRDLERRVEVDHRQERLLVRRFREVFSTMFKEQAKYSEGLPIDLRMNAGGEGEEEEEEDGLAELEEGPGEVPGQVEDLSADSEGNLAAENLSIRRVLPVTTAGLMPQSVGKIQSKMTTSDGSNFIIILNKDSGMVTVAKPDSPVSPVHPPLYIETAMDTTNTTNTSPLPTQSAAPPSPGPSTSQDDGDHEIMVVLDNPAGTEEEAGSSLPATEHTLHLSVPDDSNLQDAQTISSAVQKQSVSVFNLLQRAIVDTYKTDGSKTPSQTVEGNTSAGSLPTQTVEEVAGDTSDAEANPVNSVSKELSPDISGSDSVLPASTHPSALLGDVDVHSIHSNSLDGYETELPKVITDFNDTVEEASSPNLNSLSEQEAKITGALKVQTDEKS